MTWAKLVAGVHWRLCAVWTSYVLLIHMLMVDGLSMCCSLSKQVFLQDAVNPHELPDGTSAYGDFVGSRNQRYVSPEAAAKNHILWTPLLFTVILDFINQHIILGNTIVVVSGTYNCSELTRWIVSGSRSVNWRIYCYSCTDCFEFLISILWLRYRIDVDKSILLMNCELC